MSEQPLHENEDFKRRYSKCVDDINHAAYHLSVLRQALKGHEAFNAISAMLQRGYEARRAELESEFLRNVWSIYYDIYERPRAMAEYREYEAAHPEHSWDYHPLNPNAKNKHP